MPKGYKFTPEQIENMRRGHKGQLPWNTGKGGCRRGHDPSEYRQNPSGVFMCLACKRENGAKYREQNREKVNLKNRVGRYRISVDDYHGLMAAQNERCAICGAKIDFKSCHIDHDHVTGEVRGMLCASCNTGIGLFKDSPELLMNAAKYLGKPDE